LQYVYETLELAQKRLVSFLCYMENVGRFSSTFSRSYCPFWPYFCIACAIVW